VTPVGLFSVIAASPSLPVVWPTARLEQASETRMSGFMMVALEVKGYLEPHRICRQCQEWAGMAVIGTKRAYCAMK
jgi:hypothetical protein